MRFPKLSTMLFLGGAVVLVRELRRRARARRDEDLAHLIANDDDRPPIDEIVALDGLATNPDAYGDPRAARGSGELYDVHVVDAVDTDLPDDDRAFDEGQNWLESLETSAAEYGAKPEQELDVVDDSDDSTTHPTDTRDIPVADRGSAGPRGL